MTELCPICGTPLHRANQKYCGPGCKQKAHRERKRMMETPEGRELLARWASPEYGFNRLAIHYLRHVYAVSGPKEADYAARVIGLIRDGLDFKEP